MASNILVVITDTEAFSNDRVRAIPLPISLKKAYYELSYRIFDE